MNTCLGMHGYAGASSWPPLIRAWFLPGLLTCRDVWTDPALSLVHGLLPSIMTLLALRCVLPRPGARHGTCPVPAAPVLHWRGPVRPPLGCLHPPLLIPAAFARQLSRRISERPLSPAPPSPAFSPQWRTTLRLWHQRPPCTLHGYQLRAPSAQLWYPTRPSIPRLRGPPVRCCHTAHCCSGLQPRRGTTHAPPLDRTNATHGYSPKCFSWKAPGWTRPLRLPRRAPRR